MTGGVTPRQLEQLQALVDHGATGLSTALGPYDGRLFNPTLLSKLVAHGWADFKVIRAGRMGGQRTVYWLTPAGLTEAKREPS